VRPLGVVEAEELARAARRCRSVRMMSRSKHSRRRVPSTRSPTAFARGRPNQAEQRLDAPASRPLAELAAADRVPVAQQVAGRLTPGRRLDELPPDAGRGGMGGDVPVHQLASVMGLTRRAGQAAPAVLLDRALADRDLELEELAADPLAAPGRVLPGWLSGRLGPAPHRLAGAGRRERATSTARRVASPGGATR
jgi:hypothetical protein